MEMRYTFVDKNGNEREGWICPASGVQFGL